MSKQVLMIDKKGGTEIKVPAVNVELMKSRGWKVKAETLKSTSVKKKRK